MSRATASRVLRGETNVSERARVAVEAAARELSYTPNRAARSLVTGRSDSVAFLVDEGQERVFTDPFLLGLLRGAQSATVQMDSQLIFSLASTPEEHARFLRYAAGRHVDGVLVASLHGEGRLLQDLETAGVPTVLSGRPMVRSDQVYFVDVDNVGGARLATRHLLDAGRRRVATVTGPQDMCAGRDRLRGYADELREHGLPMRTDLVVEGDFTMATGDRAMSRLLAAEPAVDAVFAASDLMALGVMHAIERSGRRIPDDVAVVGFDDIPEAARATPALTTVRQPSLEIGETMVRVLMARIAGLDVPRVTILPVELVQRATG